MTGPLRRTAVGLTVAAAMLTLLANCAQPSEDSGPTAWAQASDAGTSPSPGPSRSRSVIASGAGGSCQPGQPWDCTQQRRFSAASTYVRAKSGYLGVVMFDRRSGAVWRAGSPDHSGWTASTIKLGMIMDVLDRQRAGQVSITTADRTDIANMLSWSDNNAADRIWHKYGGAAMLTRLQSRYGMTGVTFVDGFDEYWGLLKCTTNDLVALMRYVLDQAHPDDRAYLVNAMRNVAQNQRWGVWAAGSQAQPGDKDGWSFETDSYGKHWVTNSVGFAGPDQRYVVAVMYQLAPDGTLAGGVHAISDLVALLFGQSTPASIVVPEPDG